MNTAIAQLRDMFPADQQSADPAILSEHSTDASNHAATLPDVVLWPADTAEVSQIVRFCNAHHIPIVARGAGSSIEGSALATHGGVVLNFGRMNSIIAIYPDDAQAVVQAGVGHHNLNEALAEHNLIYVPMLGPNATMGGMLACNAAGYRTVRYGAAKDNVLGLEVVLPNGDIMRTGCRALKQSAGYDLTHLIVGSEGTLGIITEATVKLHPKPAAVCAAIAGFSTVAEAAQAAVAIKTADLAPTALELLSVSSMRYLSLADGIDFPIQPTLLMEFGGATEQLLQHRLAHLKQICEQNESTYIQTGVGEPFRDNLWGARVVLYNVIRQENEGMAYYTTDAAVPLSNLPELITFTSDLVAQYDLENSIISHAGDGNMHSLLFYPPESAETAAHISDEIGRKAISLDGTITGEHGVGIGKLKLMREEHDPVALNLMKTLKRTLDPNNILNPGKVVELYTL